MVDNIIILVTEKVLDLLPCKLQLYYITATCIIFTAQMLAHMYIFIT